MPDATASNGFQLQDTGSNDDIWGEENNENFDLVDERFDGVNDVTVTGSFALTIANYLSSPGRKVLQRLLGTPAADFTVTVPARDLNRWFHNTTDKIATITNGAGVNAIVRPGTLAFVFSDAVAGCFAADPTLDKIKPAAAAVDFNGQKGTNAAAPTANGDLANKGYVDTFTANRSAGNFELVSMADGTTPQSAVNLRQLQQQVWNAGFIPSGSAVGQTIVWDGTKFSPGKLDLSDVDARTGILPPEFGGTGSDTKSGALISLIGDPALSTGKALLSNGAAWVPGSLGTSIPVQSKSANYTVLATDAGTLIECTATLTLSLTAAATLGNGFTFFVRVPNLDTFVTLDPNGSELIDGLTTVRGYAGDNLFIVTCNGTSFRTSRARGVVLIGRTVVGTAVATLDREIAFDDGELSRMDFTIAGISHAYTVSPTSLNALVKKGGSYVTTGYLDRRTITSSGGVNGGGATTSVFFTNGFVHTLTASGIISISNFGNAAASTQLIQHVGIDPDTTNSATCVDGTCLMTSTGVIQGLRLLSQEIANIDAGTVVQYGVRA